MFGSTDALVRRFAVGSMKTDDLAPSDSSLVASSHQSNGLKSFMDYRDSREIVNTSVLD